MIEKSSRHSKIIGNFGENLLCNFLSRSGFEVSIVDHTGLDIIAYHKKSKRRLGITVKSRTRDSEKDNSSVNIFSYQDKNDKKKLVDACEYFNCEPWIGIYVETENYADFYLISLEHYESNYKTKDNKAIDDWKMTEKHKEEYINDKYIWKIHIDFKLINWGFK